ncbi:MAG: Flp family type IVb pilin [Phycisphaerales bacterium]|jgi:Flp pilus assembly pilin Flp
MKNWIMNFIADERGAESTELGVSALVVGGGAIAGFEQLRNGIRSKNTELIDRLGSTDIDTNTP